jgi:hypothetical protein
MPGPAPERQGCRHGGKPPGAPLGGATQATNGIGIRRHGAAVPMRLTAGTGRQVTCGGSATTGMAELPYGVTR